MKIIENLGKALVGKKSMMEHVKCECEECGDISVITLAAYNQRGGADVSCIECKVSPKSKKYKSLYHKWFQIKSRCYDVKDKGYPNYGGRGVTMCDEWLNDKQAFFEWSKLNGWSEDMQIDKDIKSKELGIYPPIYSPETCMYVSNTTNSRATRKIISTNTSGFRGVSEIKLKNPKSTIDKYQASIKVNNIAINLGTYTSKLQAAIEYDDYVISNSLEHTINDISTKDRELLVVKKKLNGKIYINNRDIKSKEEELNKLQEELNLLKYNLKENLEHLSVVVTKIDVL